MWKKIDLNQRISIEGGMRERYYVKAGACELVIVVPLVYHHVQLTETTLWPISLVAAICVKNYSPCVNPKNTAMLHLFIDSVWLRLINILLLIVYSAIGIQLLLIDLSLQAQFRCPNAVRFRQIYTCAIFFYPYCVMFSVLEIFLPWLLLLKMLVWTVSLSPWCHFWQGLARLVNVINVIDLRKYVDLHKVQWRLHD